MANDKIKLLATIFLMDETYIGGKPRKSNDVNHPTNSRSAKGTSKECIVGIIERNGNVKLFHSKNKSIKSEYLMKIVKENVDINNCILFTDEYRGYCKMNKILPHQKLNHKKYFSHNGIHINTIESFWSILKRGIIGQFHWTSKKWLHLNEFCFKYNNGKEKLTFKKNNKKVNDSQISNLINRNFNNRVKNEFIVSDLADVQVNGKWNYIFLLTYTTVKIMGHSVADKK